MKINGTLISRLLAHGPAICEMLLYYLVFF